jgi:hypothetical protein
MPLGWALVLGVGWPLVFGLTLAIAPAPADPEAAPSILGVVFAYAVLAGLTGTVAGAFQRSHRTVVWAGVLGGIVLVDVVLCPVTGHHTIGLWWGVEFALVSAMIAATHLAALSLRRPPADQPEPFPPARL